MSNILEVEEKYSKLWPFIAILSGITASLLFVYYLAVDEVLLEGYLRLISFAFFALMVLSLFKVKDGKVVIRLEQIEDHIQIGYYVRDRLVYEENFELNDLDEIRVDKMPNKSLYNDFANKDRAVHFKRKKSDGWLYLTQLYGRVIPLTQEKAELILEFLREVKNRVKN